MTSDPRIALNRANWNERTGVHAGSDFYDVEGFKDGRITLNQFERAGVGDVRGKSLLHLQCHFGLDTLSWARLGAKATGVDLSEAAIDLARKLNDEAGLDARFVRPTSTTCRGSSMPDSTSSTRPWGFSPGSRTFPPGRRWWRGT